MSTEFVTIKEAVDANKGNFIGTVIKQSELKSGTKNGRDWTRRIFTIQDATSEVELTCFGDEIQFFKVGGKYEIFPWWKEKYEGKTNLGIGKYGKAHLIGTDEINNKPTESEPTPESKPTTEPPAQTVMLTTNQKIVHDEIWAFALVEAAKVYPLGTAGADSHQTARLILAQVFYKKNMDYYIHREAK